MNRPHLPSLGPTLAALVAGQPAGLLGLTAASTGDAPHGTADVAAERRQASLARRLLLGLALTAGLIQGGLWAHKTWLWTGDTIYHRALMAEILNGEFFPGGPYAGLPAFYAPLYHWLAAALAFIFRFDPLDGVKLLSLLAAPLTPLVTYYLARVLGFSRPVALIGAFFETFGGGLKLQPDRVWVDALFTGQHNFFPLFPRDAAFLVLPLGLAWTYRGLVDGWRPGPWLAGLAYALMILVHTQTAVFAAPITGGFLVLAVLLRRDLLGRAVRNAVLTVGLTLLLSSFWWVQMLLAIAQGGSFAVEMPAYRVPVKLPLQDFPLEFGVFLPLGLVGIGLTLRRLWRERHLASLLLLVWWVLPVGLAVLRPTDFPGGDTFFPRRLWQFASQPLAVMAACAVLVLLAPLLRWSRPLAIGILAAIALLASVPAGWGTYQRIGEFWTDTAFADVDWDREQNFRYGTWLAERGRIEGPRTVMAPTPDATLVWYYSGQKVVYLYPTAAIKLAFDVPRLTGFSEAEREADLIAAYSGSPERLAELAGKYRAAYVVLHRDGEFAGAVNLPAKALRGQKKEPRPTATNHYEFIQLGREDVIRFEFFSPTDGQAKVSLRARRRSQSPRTSGTLTVNGTAFQVAEGETPRDDYGEVTRAVPVRAGMNEVLFRANAAFDLARFVAYTVPLEQYRDHFEIVYEDPLAVVLRPRQAASR